MEMLANGSIDGFIMALSAETQLKNDYNHLKEVTEQGIPLVLFDRVTDEIICDKVIINDREAAYKAVEKLIQSGKKRIALFTTERYLNVSKKRAEGYQEALRDYNIKIDDDLVLQLPYQFEDEVKSEKFFKDHEFDALLCVNEIFAVRAMRIAKKLDIKIPEELSIIGFTDGILSKLSTPSLTSVAQHGIRMGEISAEMLIEKIESDKEQETYRTEILEASIIERESTIH